MLRLYLTPEIAEKQYPDTWGKLYELRDPQQREGAKVYTCSEFIVRDGRPFTYELMTTNRELYLDIGAAGDLARIELCRSLERQFDENMNEDVLVTLAQSEEPGTKQVFCFHASLSAGMDDQSITIVLSPARK